MRFKRLFQASFEESLNLKDDEISGKFAERSLSSAQENEKYRGTTQAYVWSTIYSILFLIGPAWLLALVNNYFFYHPNPEKFTIQLSNYNFLPYWVFWMLLALWLLLIVIGKRFRQSFILIYRTQFHFLVSFVFWLLIELNLFGLTIFTGTGGFWGILAFGALLVLVIYYIVRSRVVSLLILLYGSQTKERKIDQWINKLFALLMKYGWAVIAIWILLRFIFPDLKEVRTDWIAVLGIIAMLFAVNIAIFAFEVYWVFPYMLQGYYKLKYPEDYRQWEGKTPEEWYGEDYLKKHGGQIKNDGN